MHTDIKTFEDACKALQLNSETVLPVVTNFPEQHQKALTAHAKLIVIADALNEGWKPDWNNGDEYKYYPWFDMENGFVFIVCVYDFQASGVGSRLCFRSRELAEYAGTQFEDLYKEYFTL